MVVGFFWFFVFYSCWAKYFTLVSLINNIFVYGEGGNSYSHFSEPA